MSTGTTTAIETDKTVAQTEIRVAWENHKRNGLDFGRVCYDWQERFGKSKGGYGSDGQGLSGILNVLSIPRHIAYYWVNEYKASTGKGVPCPSCSETFPSKTKLRKHQNKVHLVPRPVTPVAPVAPVTVAPFDSAINPETGRAYNMPAYIDAPPVGGIPVSVVDRPSQANRGHGMGLSRWRPVAEQLGYKLGCDSSGNFILSKGDEQTNLGEREASLREFLQGKADLTVTPPKEWIRCEQCGEERPSGSKHVCLNPQGAWHASRPCPLCQGTGRVAS